MLIKQSLSALAMVSLGMALGMNAAGAAELELQSWPQAKPASLAPAATIQVVNVWATWCVPCRKEMPLLSRWYTQQLRQDKKALEVVGVAMDSDANLRRFTQQVKVAYPLLRYTGTDSRRWMQGLGNVVGGLPFTLVRAPQCDFSQTILGAVNETKLNLAVSAARQQCRRKGIKL